MPQLSMFCDIFATGVIEQAWNCLAGITSGTFVDFWLRQTSTAFKQYSLFPGLLYTGAGKYTKPMLTIGGSLQALLYSHSNKLFYSIPDRSGASYAKLILWNTKFFISYLIITITFSSSPPWELRFSFFQSVYPSEQGTTDAWRTCHLTSLFLDAILIDLSTKCNWPEH